MTQKGHAAFWSFFGDSIVVVCFHHEAPSVINTLSLIWRSECFFPHITLFVQAYRTFHPFYQKVCTSTVKWLPVEMRGIRYSAEHHDLELAFDNNPATFYWDICIQLNSPPRRKTHYMDQGTMWKLC
jgi:hypothetical protein